MDIKGFKSKDGTVHKYDYGALANVPQSEGTPENGADGGYYIPKVTQPDDNTVQFAFAPSQTDMPTVDPVQVTLPGSDSGGNAELSKYIDQISIRAHFVSSDGYVLSIDTGAMTVDVPDGYLFIRNPNASAPARLTIKKTVCAINTESAFSFVVVDITTSTVLSINPANFDSTKQVMIAVLWRNYYTNPSANWVLGAYKVNGYTYNSPVNQPVYVSTTGSDSAIGDRNHPFKTIGKAIASGAKTIFVFAGIYNESISVSRTGDEIEILAKPLSYTDKDVVIDLGTELTMVADTATGLVKAAFASTSDDFIYKAFVSKTETLIYADSFNIDGYTCNLWHGDTKLTPVLTLAECQATPNTWFYDGTNVYANSGAGTYTLADGTHDYGIYVGYFKKVKLLGITVKHAKMDGVRLEGCTDAEISRCKFGYTGLYTGLALSSTSAMVRNCEAMYNRTDGFNIHGVSTADFIYCISHDNGDDGISHHDHSGGMVIGGEFYNNGKAAVCSPTFGSRNGINGVYIHDNANGIYAVTDSDGDYPPCTVSNCAIVNNTNGIRSSRYTLNCLNNVLSGNSTDVKEENGGTINIIHGNTMEKVENQLTEARKKISGFIDTLGPVSIDTNAKTLSFGSGTHITYGGYRYNVGNTVHDISDFMGGSFLFFDPITKTLSDTYSDSFVYLGALWKPQGFADLHISAGKLVVDGMPVTYTAKYYDKKINCLGDSMTDGVGTTKAYHQWLGQLCGFSTVRNYGLGGSCIAPKVDTVPDWEAGIESFLDRYTTMDDDADAVLVFGGVNDWVTGRTLGALTDAGTDTFYGAMKSLCAGLIAKYPTSDIYVFSSPQNDYINRPANNLSGTQWEGNTEGNNRKGHKLQDYTNAMKEVCAVYGIPFYSLTDNLFCGLSGVLGDNKGTSGVYGSDALHPNAEGHKKIALKMAGFINAY